MQTGTFPGARFRAGTTARMVLVAGAALLAAGCASHSSVGGLPARQADYAGRCPLGQAKVCQVGWPSRLEGNERGHSCRCG